ncbi:3D-(3,5/4)-trihydroxycyclohexane-1,2-dione acylhydrolase (decyclizing) [Lacimicrobium alkaliphilum]|uniref:3D-(3,5/4)-trihydroxycyclohexane-1,2-dione acylhydrolase (Decyclizing) n=1 Tax=Lacimicrobium alkaliphilum TaxID=1526571 RepID=A0ABQ1RJD8_9ALTE|nr:3D-(3,5/4)-trihydroxycyclohexane-1,2-dione acylhydrolase (decyclizing) [Lacimicrobium alkaliphilum]GGD69914.1 3D-(3,5/4)-trihydroxycyclohexane-1,2-dione acylhydrolase (decyclizing) [Lacimicrobium alkaliphilum]
METIRLTASQALIRYLAQQFIDIDGQQTPLFGGAFAIFGHGNVAGVGEALYKHKDEFPTYRAHNEQGMAHSAIAFAKQQKRQRMMMCTTSIGPGALNMVTAAGLAHANRLPVLFVVGDTFANRTPDPVLQQIECFGDPTISVNDCFKPVSRYFDRFVRPEQLITSLPMAIQTLLDPANCGPVTLAFPQDVQAEAYDFPVSLFAETVHKIRRPGIEAAELAHTLELLSKSQRPLIIAGGGVQYSRATDVLSEFAESFGIPVAETQAGKGSLPWNHPMSVGAIGVTGTTAANQLAREADLILAIGSRLQDFTTQSRTFIDATKPIIQINVGHSDAVKHGAHPFHGDAKTAIESLHAALCSKRDVNSGWTDRIATLNQQWHGTYDEVTRPPEKGLPSDAQVLGALKRRTEPTDVIVCAAGGLPGELHKLWRCDDISSYHVEYGFSCMGYEVAGGLGVKLADRHREVFVVVGDGSYMMMNSELATSVMLGAKVIVILLDNRGFGCINRLQKATGNKPFNNLFNDCLSQQGAPAIDFAAHARSMGADSEKVSTIDELEQAIVRARKATNSYLIAIDTDPDISTPNGDAWWDVAIPQVSDVNEVKSAQKMYLQAKSKQPY